MYNLYMSSWIEMVCESIFSMIFIIHSGSNSPITITFSGPLGTPWIVPATEDVLSMPQWCLEAEWEQAKDGRHRKAVSPVEVNWS